MNRVLNTEVERDNWTRQTWLLHISFNHENHLMSVVSSANHTKQICRD